MGNQQPKDRTIIAREICNAKDFNSDLFNSDLGPSQISWRQDSQSSTANFENNHLSSFIIQDSKNAFVTVQIDFVSTRPHSHLSVKMGEKLNFKEYSPDGQWANVSRNNGKESGWVPSNVIGEVTEEDQNCTSYLQKFSWYHGIVQRSFAEYLLNSGINGCFLVRESESDSDTRSVSLRYDSKIFHFRIWKDSNNKYYLVEGQRFNSIEILIEHHSKYSDTLPCQLLYAAPKRARATVFGVAENDSQDNWEIDRTEITMKDQLGGGQYGIVYEGYWKRHNITVAVKTVKADITVAGDFLEEARLMKSLQHPNLVRLLGICTREPPNYIITEFMENGNLLEYLRKRPKEELSPSVLLYMAIQISAGMEYLEEHNFIHRDLAARNCLVGQDNIIKVADFGLARCMERDDTYTAHVGAKFPIKWTAPESLAYNLFSTKSDIWAFGILLWELATYGMTPYLGIELKDVYEHLENGNIMSRPSGCPDNIYELMKQCWQWKPENRPTFKTLHSELKTLLSNITEQVDLEVAKENGLFDLSNKKSNFTEGGSSANTLDPPHIAQSFNKRKEVPVPPLRTSTLRNLSSVSVDLPFASSDCILPKIISGSNGLESKQRRASNLPPPVLKTKPKRIESSEVLSTSLIDVSLRRNSTTNKMSETDSVCTVYPKLPISNIFKMPRNVTNEFGKRALSDRTDSVSVENDFQSELRSRLKDARSRTGNGSVDDRASLSPLNNSENQTTAGHIPAHGVRLLPPSNKRMTWNGPLSSRSVVAKQPLNILSSSSVNCCDENESEAHDVITKDDLLLELNSLDQELTCVNTCQLSALVDRLETIEQCSVSFCNSSINSAKIKFKCIDQCGNIRKGIEALKKCLKPFDQSSALNISNGIRTNLFDLKTLIETGN